MNTKYIAAIAALIIAAAFLAGTHYGAATGSPVFGVCADYAEYVHGTSSVAVCNVHGRSIPYVEYSTVQIEGREYLVGVK